MLKSAENNRIFEISNIKEVEQYIDEDCAVAWDVDDTIYEPADSFFPGDAWFYFELTRLTQDGQGQLEAFKQLLPLYIEAQHKTKVKACEDDTVDLIKRLQEKGIVNFCLTSRGAEVKQATLNQLASLGLNFNDGRFEDKTITINIERHRALNHGVIFCSGGSSKGNCLKTVLQDLDYTPKKLVFIDDKRDYLESVKKACEEMGIEFVGLRYGFLDEKKKTINAEVVAIQQAFFKHPIMSDADAKALLKARKQVKCGIQRVTKPGKDKDYALLWTPGDQKDAYDRILELSPEMKKEYRSFGKYYKVNGHEILCSRFKVPVEQMSKFLPSLFEQNLLNEEQFKEYNELLNQPSPKTPSRSKSIVTQFELLKSSPIGMDTIANEQDNKETHKVKNKM